MKKILPFFLYIRGNRDSVRWLRVNRFFLFFLVACTRLYIPLCPSVCRLVCWSVGLSVCLSVIHSFIHSFIHKKTFIHEKHSFKEDASLAYLALFKQFLVACYATLYPAFSFRPSVYRLAPFFLFWRLRVF